VAAAAADSMAEFKDPACAEIILPLVKHAHAFVRMGALRALKELRCKDTLKPALEALQDSDAAVRASSLVLEYMNATPEHVFEARSSLELKCVELATERIDESGIIRVRETLHLEEQAQREGRYPTHDLHTVLADLTGNPAFVLFVEVLTNLTSGSRQGERTQKTAAAARLAHDKIAEAVISGDVALARHRMQAHLAAIGTWMGKSGGSSARPKRAAAADPRP